MLRLGLLFLFLSAVLPVVYGQQVVHPLQAKQLEWRIEQQPTSRPCTEEDLAFARAPEQIALAQSYGAPFHPGMHCETIVAKAFYGARVLRIAKPSTYDDGYGYTLVQPKGASTARLIFGGGSAGHLGHENEEANLAAMNAMLQTSDVQNFEKADWLAISLAYLTILAIEPTLNDRTYAPGPNEHFGRYTGQGLLSDLPTLARLHLLPWVTCAPGWCEVRFYYRTETFDPFEKCTFRFEARDGSMRLTSARVVEGSRATRKRSAQMTTWQRR